MNRVHELNLECPICISSSTDTSFIILRCSHVLCVQCMFNTIRSSCKNACPLCRQEDEVWVRVEHELYDQMNDVEEDIYLDNHYLSSYVRIIYVLFCLLCCGLAMIKS